MSFQIKRLTTQEIRSISHEAINILYWIRQEEPNEAADVIVAVLSKPDSVKGHLCLRDFMYKERNHRTMSVQEAKVLFQKHDVAHWVNAFLLLLCADNLFSEFAYEGMMAVKDDSIEEFMVAFRRLSYVGHHLLCSMCSAIQNASLNAAEAFDKLAPILFFGSAYKKRAGEAADASSLLQFIAKNQQKLFGFVEESKEVTAYGPIRSSPAAGTTAEMTVRVNQLKSFYEQVDGQFASLAGELFELHEFKDIAEALVSKYNNLPEDWIDGLRGMQQAGEDMPWFNYEHLLSHGATPVLMRGRSFVKGPQDYGKTTKINAIIDELIDTEIVYYDKLQAFMKGFVETLRAVANGSQGRERMDAIGMTEKEVDLYFGGHSKLRSVYQTSEKVLRRLEVINLVRKDTKEGARSRAKVVADVFGDLSDDITKTYSPYGGWFATTDNQIRKQSRVALKAAGKKNLLTFEQLYDQVANQDDKLFGTKIASILIEPVQRVPRYKILIERLAKAAKESDVAKKIEEILVVILRVAESVDQGVKRGKKLANFFGNDEERDREIKLQRVTQALHEL